MTTFKYQHSDGNKITIKAETEETALNVLENLFKESNIGEIKDWELIQ